ncbi:MAG: EI24 domain-containing protein [Archangiaceae bacterium]|nr:EI24 domain-containing protein [Archangiaceae bacterium]
MPSATPVPALSGGFSDFFAGLSLPFRSLSVMRASGRVLGLSLFSSLVTGVTLVGLVIGLWPLGSRIARTMVGNGAWGSVLSAFFYLLLLVASALTVPALLLAPLQDPISEATESHCGDFTAPPFSMGRLFKSAGTSIAHTASRLAILVIGFFALLPLNLVPAVGSVAYGVVSTVWAAWWLTAEYLSGPMARHLLPFRRVLATMRERPMVCLGFGFALYVLLWVPVLNFFLVPIAVVGGTLLFRALKPHLP